MTSARRIREASGITQEKLAAQAGVSLGTIRNLESGKSITTDNALAIAKALGVTVDALLNGNAS